MFLRIAERHPAVAGAITLLLALIVAGCLYLFGFFPVPPPSGSASMSFVDGLVGLALLTTFVPLVETLLLLGAVRTTQMLAPRLHTGLQLGVAAAILAAVHGIKWWGVPVIVLLPFVVFVQPFEPGRPTWVAFRRSALVHAFHNLYAGLLLFIGLLME